MGEVHMRKQKDYSLHELGGGDSRTSQSCWKVLCKAIPGEAKPLRATECSPFRVGRRLQVKLAKVHRSACKLVAAHLAAMLLFPRLRYYQMERINGPLQKNVTKIFRIFFFAECQKIFQNSSQYGDHGSNISKIPGHLKNT